MEDNVLPSMQEAKTVSATYRRAFYLLLPTIVIYNFANIFLIPKLEYIWDKTNLEGSSAQVLMDVTYLVFHHSKFIFFIAVLALVALEIWGRNWPRYRSGVVSSFVTLCQTAVLFGLTALAVAAVMAAPRMGITE